VGEINTSRIETITAKYLDEIKHPLVKNIYNFKPSTLIKKSIQEAIIL
jgi:hypothetical protein